MLARQTQHKIAASDGALTSVAARLAEILMIPDGNLRTILTHSYLPFLRGR